jgi:DNA-directed RNA polymerase subunit RPC12/RpoP
MGKSLNSTRLDAENSKNKPSFGCSKCRETFQKPILATLSSQGYVQTYYACPLCLSEVTIIKQQKGEAKEASTSIENPMKTSEAKEGNNAGCQHFFGYLKTRPKDKSFPDECLTCNKMVECMVR